MTISVKQHFEAKDIFSTSLGETLRIRHCTLQDLNDIMTLQEAIDKGMNEHTWFVTTSREENTVFLSEPNAIIGIYDDAKLIAYGSVGFPGKKKDNLGWDLEWPEEKVLRCATLDTIVVAPDYRGLGLQRKIIELCVKHARQIIPDCTILTTICPDNIYSLRNGLTCGFEILTRKQKYGGYDRYILGLMMK